MATESVDLVVTDPVWLQERRFPPGGNPTNGSNEIVGAEEIDASWIPDTHRVLKTGGAAYVFAKQVNMGEWKSLLESGIYFHQLHHLG